MVDHKKLAKFRQLITEGLRVQLGHEPITYINVGHAMEDVSAKQNHTVFARRGCGKTLLLHDSTKQLPSEIKAVYLNCEDFKQHTFPNVLVEILSSLFAEIGSRLSGWFGRRARTKQIIQDIRAKLGKMHQWPDVHEEAIKHIVSDEGAITGDANLKTDALKFSLGGSKKEKSETERSPVRFTSWSRIAIEAASSLSSLSLSIQPIRFQVRTFVNAVGKSQLGHTQTKCAAAKGVA
jgi:hypothetical protein